MYLLAFFVTNLLSVFADDLLVQTAQGAIQGHYNEVGIREWRGIPYAQPPVGELRFEYPASPKPFDGIYQATFNAPGCPQTCKLPPGNCPEWGTSEDCLYLSVFAPTEPSKDPEGYPVLFWIHGGAFEQGLGNCALYNGTNFAQKGVVSVVINYRLGALGFTAATNMQGNYGFMDQRMALQWTNQNIKAFGGNPNKVTIAGQSAGAMSVACHMVSKNSKGLFQGAIMESNPLGLPYHDRQAAGANADSMFQYVGCAPQDVACMKTKSVEEILDAQDHAIKLDFDTLLLNFLPFAPLIEENGEIPGQPLDLLAQGKIESQVPLLQGSLYDEGQLFVYELFPKPLGEIEYATIIDGVFGLKNGKVIQKKYPFNLLPNNTDARNVLNVLATDLLFYCPLRNITRGFQSVLGKSVIPTFTYRFKHILSFDCWGENYTFCVGSCCHGSELPFVFNVFTDGVSLDYTPTADERALTTDLSNAWTNFISRGTPNLGYPIPQAYPQYETASDVLVILDEPDQSLESHTRATYCDMWDTLGYIY